MALPAKRPIKMTYEDYLCFNDDKRRELINGDFFVSPSPSSGHQSVSQNIFSPLKEWVKKHDLGKVFYAPLDVVFDENDVVQPDILYIAKEHEKIIEDRGVFGPPDLAIEIISPTSKKMDALIKRHLYSKYGVGEYWIVDPEAQTVAVLVPENNELQVKQTYRMGTSVESTLLKGFRLKVEEIFKP